MNPLEVRPEGLYCKPGDFFIDAWKPVKKCIITHAHGDHAYFGHQHYLTSENTKDLLSHRLGPECPIESLPFDKKIKINNCWISLHPAGHILGSAQVRIEVNGTVCVISGDYKRCLDNSCEPFSLQECDIFVTESTFGLPIYNWEDPKIIAQRIVKWWQENKLKNTTSVLLCYPLGKAQRILSMLHDYAQEPIYVHGAILSITDIYKKKGIVLPSYLPITENKNDTFEGKLILAPPLAKGSRWMKRFYPYKTALASGWMQVRGMRKRKNLDYGFALSDHADWPALLQTIKESRASLVLTTHGNSSALAKYLQEQDINACPLAGMEWVEEEED